MHKNLIDIISHYLKIDTNYALIINGKYGTGKTHFYHEKLVPEIKNIFIPETTKKYKPIHVSLFGVSSIEDIQTAIFIELYPFLNSKSFKLATGLAKVLARGLAQVQGLGDPGKYLSDLKPDKKALINISDIVICLDDIDRKSDSLSLKDILGFINTLVENQNAKIILIANEEVLITDEHYSSELREKVIGVSVHFVPVVAKVFDEIIKKKYYKKFRAYYDFLHANSTNIVSAIELNENNFRNLLFFLENFKSIFRMLERLFEKDKSFSINKEEKTSAVLEFTLATSIEYKLGHLNSTNLEEIKNLQNDPFFGIDVRSLTPLGSDKTEDSEPEVSYIDSFQSKYFNSKTFIFFESIFEFITGVKGLNKTQLKGELEENFRLEDGKIPEEDKILQDLKYLDCLNYSMPEYRSLTNKMLAMVDSGTFPLRRYVTVFHYATRFKNILGYDLDKLKQRFKKGIKKGDYQYVPDLRFHTSLQSDMEYYEESKEIVEFCLKINETQRETKNQTHLKELLNQFKEDYTSFLEKISARESGYRFDPFWAELPVKKVYSIILKLSGEEVWNLGNYYKSRYSHVHDSIEAEKEFISDLITLIDKPTLKRRKKSLYNSSLDYLSEILNDAIKHFPS